jgi:hypothetical protein
MILFTVGKVPCSYDKVVDITTVCRDTGGKKITLQYGRFDGEAKVSVMGASVYAPCFELDYSALLSNARFREEAQKLGLAPEQLHAFIGKHMPFDY